MINTTRFAARSAAYLKRELKLNEEQAEVTAFALDLLYSSTFSFLAVYVISALLGVADYAMVAMITVALIRVFSGGAHCTSSARCLSAGVATYPVFGIALKRIAPLVADMPGYVMIFAIITAGAFAGHCIFLWAPAETPGKPVSTKLARRVLRGGAFAAAAIITLAAVFAAACTDLERGLIASAGFGLIWQGFSLAPAGYRFVGFLDNLLSSAGVE